jgi:hypothetical protein
VQVRKMNPEVERKICCSSYKWLVMRWLADVFFCLLHSHHHLALSFLYCMLLGWLHRLQPGVCVTIKIYQTQMISLRVYFGGVFIIWSSCSWVELIIYYNIFKKLKIKFLKFKNSEFFKIAILILKNIFILFVSVPW